MSGIEGHSFAFTGSLGFSRREIRAELEQRGAIYHPRVTRGTDYLVIGRILPSQGKNGITNKMRLADQYLKTGSPIRILSAPEFLLMLVTIASVAN